MAFIDKNFLLKNETAKKLFFEYANTMPIFDFHCHLSPKDIYENNNFENITQAWLGGDHYKWRLMRSVGIDEKYITGDATGLDKFKMFAKTLDYSIGNPVYHWAHLELQRFFDEYQPLTEKNAEEIYNRVNLKLKDNDFKVRNFIKKANVKFIFTTDDPIDSLEYHIKIKEDSTFTTKVLPAFRPDKAMNIEATKFKEYIETLSNISETKINNFDNLLHAIENRINYFHKVGCCASDHAFKHIPYESATKDELDNILQKGLKGDYLSSVEIDKYKTALIKFLAAEYKKRDWVMEIHYGVLRDTNSTMFNILGPDTGFDTMADYNVIENLSKLLDSINSKEELPKTILFAANPNHNYALGTLIGCFQNADAESKIQLGTAWWFNDHINGMTAQINALADVGVLGKFIGMLTDSRSFLSYPRHEYFRRILCNIVGNWVENGEYNTDLELTGKLIKDISYNNAIKYFNM